jgi:predicted transcriptional regulator
MELAVDELRKSLRYHIRQLEDNRNKIESNLQSNDLLREKSLIHEQTIEELNQAIEQLKRD